MQRHNPVTEQELLAITETLKYYKHMLFGHKIVVKTDHKNLAHQLSTHASDRVLHQCLLHKEYGVLPTEEIFSFEEANDDFPLNINRLAAKQLTDAYFQAALQKQQPDYIESVREGCKIYVYKPTNTVYVPGGLSPIGPLTVVPYRPPYSIPVSNACRLQ